MFSVFARIKPSHRPRIVWAFVALVMMFGLLYLNAVGLPVNLYDPVIAGGLFIFLLGGISMLIYSWFEGLDGVIEWGTIWLLLGLHVALDISLIYQMQNGRISLDLVQYAVEMYWVAGLIDILIMGWGYNAERIKKGYKSPEQLLQEESAAKSERIADLQRDLAVLQHSYSNASASSSDDRAEIEELKKQLAARDQKHADEIQRMRNEMREEREQMRQQRELELQAQQAAASQTYSEECPRCHEIFTTGTPESARRALAAHMSNPAAIEKCKLRAAAVGGANGHSHNVENSVFQHS